MTKARAADTRSVKLAVVLVLAIVATLVPAAPRADAAVPTSGSAWDLRPDTVWKAIPFGEKRRRQMGAYSRRHYGDWAWRLRNPKVVVEHYTAGDTFSGAYNTFASNDAHLGEKPGTCAHFVIDKDGTIYQLVNLRTRCRHVIGINYTSFGIEHVGRSADGILRNRAMMRSSLRLTLWLMAQFGIELRNVIGHNESLRSPYHHERYPDWRCLTHADWNRAEMRIYRDRLKRRARAAGVRIGPPSEWVDPNC